MKRKSFQISAENLILTAFILVLGFPMGFMLCKGIQNGFTWLMSIEVGKFPTHLLGIMILIIGFYLLIKTMISDAKPKVNYLRLFDGKKLATVKAKVVSVAKKSESKLISEMVEVL